MPDDSRPARERPIPWMDKQSGHKDTAFTWEMGELILSRIAEGETMKAITAHPRMPAYCTVFRWMQVVPEFGAAVDEARAALAARRLAERDAVRAKRRRGDRGGRPSTFTGPKVDLVFDGIRAGASLSEVLAKPGAPSTRVVYRALQTCPGIRELFVQACDYRAGWLEFQSELVGDAVCRRGLSIAAANAEIRRIIGRRGRLTPKLYRTRPRLKSDRL
ncbi:hypothetical protein [Phenylobacterium kunshanense]|uniref:Uncharacterized protein n=1 Tax=Phenylobacterium kunshanense TaxID=1445034 RepID=A0A328BEL6_9CAUL|nr:hypothetical protein [Phenylobacterium kunshanense]RAK64891.1 hypothetical protein DJ019_12845 [Phenylobacterium kunshanense]